MKHPHPVDTSLIGIVAIGRNEGHRLVPCLESILEQNTKRIVYVDSGSHDGSAELARSMGFPVVELGSFRKFSAGRARNAGYYFLRHRFPTMQFVQFVDGDSMLRPGWIKRGVAELVSEDRVAMVCGHVDEKFAASSIFKRMCQIEWHGAVGDISACGGNAMLRSEAFASVNGFNPDVVAAEDNELCARLRFDGYSIRRIDAPMVLHDSPVMTTRQWWKRSEREGQCYLQVAALHWHSSERTFVKPLMSACFWGLLLPTLLVALTLIWNASFLAFGLAIYVLLAMKVAVSTSKTKHASTVDSLLYGCFCVLGKLPQCIGIAKTLSNWARSQPSRLIEYERNPDHLLSERLQGDGN